MRSVLLACRAHNTRLLGVHNVPSRYKYFRNTAEPHALLAYRLGRCSVQEADVIQADKPLQASTDHQARLCHARRRQKSRTGRGYPTPSTHKPRVREATGLGRSSEFEYRNLLHDR